jgi:hypothetical protein
MKHRTHITAALAGYEQRQAEREAKRAALRPAMREARRKRQALDLDQRQWARQVAERILRRLAA